VVKRIDSAYFSIWNKYLHNRSLKYKKFKDIESHEPLWGTHWPLREFSFRRTFSRETDVRSSLWSSVWGHDVTFYKPCTLPPVWTATTTTRYVIIRGQVMFWRIKLANVLETSGRLSIFYFSTFLFCCSDSTAFRFMIRLFVRTVRSNCDSYNFLCQCFPNLSGSLIQVDGINKNNTKWRTTSACRLNLRCQQLLGVEDNGSESEV